jgi:hypothetical protein
LVVGGKGVLVERHQFRVIRAGFREVGKILSNRSDQIGLSSARASWMQALFLEAEQLLGVSASNLHPVVVADGSMLKPVFSLDYVFVRVIN